MSHNLFDLAYTCLMTPSVAEKCHLSRDIARAWQQNSLTLDNTAPPLPVSAPGRPDKPELVPPRQVKQRKPNSPMGRASLLHALAHIEFNAINLAWDAVYRFRDLPRDYYRDWIQVAVEEVLHFELLTEHLRSLDCAYGDYPAHNSLWEMALETDYDVLARMALVPRFLEARGLDVTPGIKEKLLAAGDKRAAEILDLIFRDEIGHVAAGSRWFQFVCEQRALQPLSVFADMIRKHLRGTIKAPFHDEARRQGGFSSEELALLYRLSAEHKA